MREADAAEQHSGQGKLESAPGTAGAGEDEERGHQERDGDVPWIGRSQVEERDVVGTHEEKVACVTRRVGSAVGPGIEHDVETVHQEESPAAGGRAENGRGGAGPPPGEQVPDPEERRGDSGRLEKLERSEGGIRVPARRQVGHEGEQGVIEPGVVVRNVAGNDRSRRRVTVQ